VARTDLKRNVGPDSKQQIIDVARQLFSELSYRGVSMSDISVRLGVTKAALYYHFAGKRELYLDVLRQTFAELLCRIEQAQTSETGARQLLRMITTYLQFGVGEHNLLNVLTTRLAPADTELRDFVADFRAQIADIFRPVVASVFGSDQSPSRVDAKLTTSMLTAMMDGLVLEHSFFGSDLDPSKVAAQIVTILGLDYDPASS